MLISVIVCTHNRAPDLLNLLNSLNELELPAGIAREFLVVDNNSTDKTRSVSESFDKGFPGIYRYIFEGRQGKSFALNTGIREAKGAILAFTDDDCIPDRHWLAAIAGEFASEPNLTVLGGRVELFNPSHQPYTILTRREKIVITSAGQILQDAHIIGCNLAIHRRALEVVPCYDPALGPATKTFSSEDTDFLYEIFRKKLLMVYSPSVLVYHNHGRTTCAEIEELKRRYFVGRGAVYFKHIRDRDVLKLSYWTLSSSFTNIVKSPFSWKAVKKEMRYVLALLKGATYRLLSHGLPRKRA